LVIDTITTGSIQAMRDLANFASKSAIRRSADLSQRAEKTQRSGPRQGSLSRKGGGRPLARDPDATVVAKALACVHCQAALTDADQVLSDLYDKVDLPPVRPAVTRVERYAGRCPCRGQVSLAPVPEGLEPATPFSVSGNGREPFALRRLNPH
jgi:hypothetical protein